MRTSYILLSLLFTAVFGYGQSIQAKDTLYIIFKSHKNLVKEDPYKLSLPSALEPVVIYKFIFNNEGTSYFQFYHAKYLDFDSFESGKVADKKILYKYFLRKNKQRVIDGKQLLKLGINDALKKLSNYKVVYIVDKDELKDGEVMAYEVLVYSTYLPGM